MAVNVLTGIKTAGGIGFWPPMLHVVQNEETGIFLNYSPALANSAEAPFGETYPVALSGDKAEEINFRMRQVKLTGGFTETMMRHSHDDFPIDERLLGGWPGINIHSFLSGGNIFSLQFGYVSNFATPTVGDVDIGDGNPWPVACDHLIYPGPSLVDYQTYRDPVLNREVYNVIPLPPACRFHGEQEYPFLRLEWTSGTPSTVDALLYTTIPWGTDTATPGTPSGLTIENTGRVLDIFGVGSTPIFCIYSLSTTTTPLNRALSADVHLEGEEWFDYDGVYDPATGNRI